MPSDMTESKMKYNHRDASPQCRVEVHETVGLRTRYDYGDASPQHRVEVPMRTECRKTTKLGVGSLQN